MSEWVPESDWSKVHVGDRVRVERAEFSAEGLVEETGGSLWLGPVAIYKFEQQKWTLYVAPKPTPALPTEPGAIIAWDEQFYYAIATLEREDQWLGNWDGQNHTTAEVLERIGNAPFTRLESQADTARKVLERVQQLFTGAPMSLSAACHKVATEFGVTP